jgi:hypothetical protein
LAEIHTILAGFGYLLGNFLKTLGYDYSINACASNGWLQPGDTSGDIPGVVFRQRIRLSGRVEPLEPD